MSRPAIRSIPQRTTVCPTCGAPKFRPCRADTPTEVDRAMRTNVWTVKPHPSRRRLERDQ